MEKFSVIIPTMWKSHFTIPLLNELSKSEYVGEIILIDNKPIEASEIKIKKVIHIKEEENTYVNPAWNKGVQLAKYNNITIANDDILFSANEYFSYLHQSIQQLTIGFIGSHSENYEIENSNNVRIELLDCQNNLGGWGCLFSFTKPNWKGIPEQFKIWYGDNIIQATNPNIFQLRGIKIQTNMSTSSDLEEVRKVRDNDTTQWIKLINNK